MLIILWIGEVCKERNEGIQFWKVKGFEKISILPQSLSTSSPAFIACRLLVCSHSDWREMVPHSGFDLHFSDNE